MPMDTYINAFTPQQKAVPSRAHEMVKNAAGGYTFAVDDFTRLERFLILGTEGGTYYAGERKLTVESIHCVERCLAQDGKRTVDVITSISESGRAPKQDPALFALAIALRKGDKETRRYAGDALPRVARTASALFDLVRALRSIGEASGSHRFSRSHRRAIANWYHDKDVPGLAYQMVKYRNRAGWTHLDLLRMAHVRPLPAQEALFRWAAQKPHADLPEIVETFERAQKAETAKDVARLVYAANLPREAVPDRFLKDREVWEALLQKMPVGAMIRNLGRMTALGLLDVGSEWASLVSDTITTDAVLRKARVHPMAILLALKTYEQGHGDKGSMIWKPNREVLTALDNSFYMAFKYLPSTGQRIRIGVDISGSMTYGACNGARMFTPAQAAGVIAMCLLRAEPKASVIGYDTRPHILEIDRDMKLSDVYREINKSGGGTDCAVPLREARRYNEDYDAFVLVTDSETWAGPSHAVEELNAYRNARDLATKMVTCAMTATRNTVGDPYDGGCLDVVGLDADLPALISDFIGN